MKTINKGFTLVELLLYVGLIGLVVLSTLGVVTVLTRQRIRSQVIAEVESQGIAAMQIMTQTIRNATVINSPGIGSTGAALNLSVTTAGLNPTVFALNNGVITMVEGGNPVVNLTSGRITVSALTFSNLTRPGSFGTVRIQYTVSYNNPGGQPEYTYSKTFISSASLR